MKQQLMYKNTRLEGYVMEDSKPVMAAYYDLENLIRESIRPKEAKFAMIWGALLLLSREKEIDWNSAKSIFAEFVLTELKLR